jgi:integrase
MTGAPPSRSQIRFRSRAEPNRARHPRTVRRYRTWNSEVAAFLAHKRAMDPVSDGWIRRMEWELERFPELLRRARAPRVVRHAGEVDAVCIETLRKGLPWETPTFAIHFQALRQFLRWAGNPLADERAHWKLPSAAPVHRRWLTREQLVTLYGAARGVERVIVGLEGFAGLRRVEVLRLRVKDVLVNDRCLRILGKGRAGGKWRNIPLLGEVDRLLTGWIRHRAPDEHVVPLSRSGADAALQRAVRRSGLARAGVRVSHHDLRRTFGRLANASGMNLVSLQGLYGHTSPALSAHYIGLDFDDLTTALDRLGTFIDVRGARSGPGTVGLDRVTRRRSLRPGLTGRPMRAR